MFSAFTKSVLCGASYSYGKTLAMCLGNLEDIRVVLS